MAAPNSDTPQLSDLAEERRARRALRKAKREDEALRKKVNEIKAPKTDKLTVISEKDYQRIQQGASEVRPQAAVKNKHFRAANVEFALTDFVVQKPVKKGDARKVPGTTVPKLKRGKVREIPKKKALSKLKRAILEIRQKRKVEIEARNCETQEKDTQETVQDAPPDTQVDHVALPITYSRKFRCYCDHANVPEIAQNAELLLKDLFRFQDRAFEKNQIKARANKRYVVGFKEVERSLDINKVKVLLIATDLEPNPGPGGLDETIDRIKGVCQEKNIPYCFPLQRRKIGYLLFKKAPISCVGVLDYDGAEEHYKAMIKFVNRSRINLSKEMEKLKINS